jgi:chemotaxis-related protein WspD
MMGETTRIIETEAPCWSRIGIDGDGSCPELVAAIHCRNCHVYADAGRTLLDRPGSNDYRVEWATRLAAEAEFQKRAKHSVVIFSLQSELLALPTTIFNEVAAMREIRRVPGALSKLLLGLVNIRGELHLCVSLHALLSLGPTERPSSSAGGSGRLLLMQKGGETWAFPVDEVHGTYRCNLESLSPPPATVGKSLVRFSRGTMDWEGKSVGCLDETAVFNALKGSMA